MYKLLLLFTLSLLANPATAEPVIEEVIVTVKQSGTRALQPVLVLSDQMLSLKTPSTMADIFADLPAVGVRTNSRGETVFRLRGSEERQTSIFLDGSPLTVPWDGRVDLSVLPASIIRKISVVKSAAPLEYGPNSILGVVEISTDRSCKDSICHANAQHGDNGQHNYSVSSAYDGGSWSMTSAINKRGHDHLSVVDRDTIPFAPIKNRIRQNTDNQSQTLWGAVDYNNDYVDLRLSQLIVDSSRGVAPAGHVDPEIKSPRYWRYPQWKLKQTTANAAYTLDNGWFYRGTAWYQQFSQTIDQYSDATYSLVSDQERAHDSTVGGRLVASLNTPTVGYRVIVNTQDTRHRQQNINFNPDSTGYEEIYQQRLFSLATELDTRAIDPLNISLGISYDYSDTPKTGGRDAQKSLSDWAGNVSLSWVVGDTLTLATTLGQRTRFPSLRELYGAALGKFIINPDLKPESARLGDISINWQPNDSLSLLANLWMTEIKNTLSKRKVSVAGEKFDQRYNMLGSSGLGLEVGVKVQLADNLEAELNSSWQHFKADVEANGERPDILQRPKSQHSVTMTYYLSEPLYFILSGQYINASMDEDIDGSILTLPSSKLFDARLFYNVSDNWTLYMAMENMTDSSYLPQLGLPAAGRTAQVGVSFKKF